MGEASTGMVCAYGPILGIRTVAQIIEHAAELLARYDVVFCDVWGVVHNGEVEFAEAGDALARFRKGGGTVVLVSNAPVPASAVENVLALTGVRREAWDAIVSSGDLTLAYLQTQGFTRIYRLGPQQRDAGLFSRLSGVPATLDEAEVIVCTGLVDDVRETPETYRTLLENALHRGLPMVCANPDLVVDVGGRRRICAGSIAALFESMGGAVHWAGKPHAPAYRAAFDAAARQRGQPVPRNRVIAIGDALRTDIAGAERAGIDALFIAGGIHHDDVLRNGKIAPDRLVSLLAEAGLRPLATMSGFRW